MIRFFLTRSIVFYLLVLSIVLMLTGCSGITYKEVSNINKNVCNNRLKKEVIHETIIEGLFKHISSNVECQHEK